MMKNPPAHFCIDIDNTVALTDEVMRRVISKFTDGRVALDYEDVVKFNYYECRDRDGNQITREDWTQVHDRFSDPGVLATVRPMPGAIEGLRRISERGGVIHLATSRLRAARIATVQWLDDHGFPTHDLHFLRHGEKHAALKRFTAAAEDHYEQAAAFATVGETPCFLIRHPWNRNREPLEGVAWVDHWDELADRLLALVSGA